MAKDSSHLDSRSSLWFLYLLPAFLSPSSIAAHSNGTIGTGNLEAPDIAILSSDQFEPAQKPCTSTEIASDSERLDVTKKKGALLSMKSIPLAFFESSVVAAVKEIIPFWVSSPGSILKMAINLVLFSAQRLPESAEELLTVTMDNEFSEQRIISSFAKICDKHGGLENIQAVPLIDGIGAKKSEAMKSATTPGAPAEHSSDGSCKKDNQSSPPKPPKPSETTGDNCVSVNNDCESSQIVDNGGDAVVSAHPVDVSHKETTPSNQTQTYLDNSSNAEPEQLKISVPLEEPSATGSNDGAHQVLQCNHVLTRALAREHERLTEAMLCVTCKKRPVEVTLLPCGHFVICSHCSNSCQYCPVCKVRALADVKTFLA